MKIHFQSDWGVGVQWTESSPCCVLGFNPSWQLSAMWPFSPSPQWDREDN